MRLNATGFIIFRDQKLFQNLMSAEEPQLEDQIDEMPMQPPKFNNQHTTIYCKPKNNPQSTVFDFEQIHQSLTDCSFQQTLHRENMEILKNAINKYLQDSIVEPFNKTLGFKDENLYENLPFQMGGSDQLQLLTLHNQLLNQREQQQLRKILNQEDDLLGLIKQATDVFGLTVAKQFVFVLYQLLKLKLTHFKEMVTPKTNILPKFDCFHGIEQAQSPFHNSCPIYEQINLQQIPHFAQKQLEQLSSSLYFSCHIKYLSLRQIKPDTKGNILHRFKMLMRQISKTLFFTIAGAVEPTATAGSTIFGLDLSREVSFSEITEGNILSIQRTISRPFVPCEQENMDFLSKKLKFE